MKVLIADDHPLVRWGVKETLGKHDAVEVIGEAQNTSETLAMVGRYKPDLLILDLDMPGCSADELAHQVCELHPPMKVLILSAHNDDKFLRKLRKVKLSGYLLKDEAPENLLQAVRTIGQGASWFSQAVAQKLLSLNQAPEEDLFAQLTPREREIMQLMADGKDNMTIASELCLSEQTVRNYTSLIYQKIGASSRVEAVLLAHKHQAALQREESGEYGEKV